MELGQGTHLGDEPDLVERAHDLGQLTPGFLADVIAVPGDPTEDIKVTKEVTFVMKDGQVYKGV